MMNTLRSSEGEDIDYNSLLSQFSALQTAQFMTVIDACHKIQTEQEFSSMIKGPMRELVPHQYAACGIGERGKLTIDYIINIDFPRQYLKAITSQRASKYMLKSPVARGWADTPQTRFVNELNKLSPDYEDWTCAVEKYGINNMLVSGLHDLSGSKTSYFCFACCDDSNPDWSKYLIDLLTPHLHKAITQVCSNQTKGRDDNNELSQREIEVLKLVSAGMTNVEVGKKLFISENTVKNHVQSIFKKLRVANRVQAVSRAFSLKLIEDKKESELDV